MKKLILTLALFFICVFSYAQTSEYTFNTGDTIATFPINSAKVVYITAMDSSLAGTDSLWMAVKFVYSNGVIGYVNVAVYALAQTTTTTRISSALLIPGDATATTWAWYPSLLGDITFSGAITLRRINTTATGGNQGTQYVGKTRVIVTALK